MKNSIGYTDGIAAARHIWEEWDEDGFICPNDPLSEEFSAGALAEYERLQKERVRGLLRAVTKRAQKGAQQLNVESWHGIIEVVQNSDDLGATEVTLAIRDGKLLMAHNGDPVLVQHVPAMTYAFFSTKSEDPNQIGRFGVGLKTLGRIGSRLEVHSGPYSFAIHDLMIEAIAKAEPVPDIYDPTAKRTTLMLLTLHDNFSLDALIKWFEELKPSLLLFLKSVTRLRLLIPDHENRTIELILSDSVPDDKFLTDIGMIERTQFISGDDLNTRYERYRVKIPVPTDHSRSDKATEDFTTLGITFADDDVEGRLYAALPTKIKTKFRFAFNAEFDPGTSRENLLDTPWNDWLMEQVPKLVSEVLIHLLMTRPKDAWLPMPIPDEAKHEDEGLMKQLNNMQKNIISEIDQRGQVLVEGVTRRMSELSFEEECLEDQLSEADYHYLSNGTLKFPKEARDEDGYYRSVLPLLSTGFVSLADAFKLFDDGRANIHPASWDIHLMKSALESGCPELLEKHPCLRLKNSDRVFCQPREIATSWVTLDYPDAARSLKRFQLVNLLSEDYLEYDEWKKVEQHLLERGNLMPQVSADALLRALAAKSDPVIVTDEELSAIKGLLDNLEDKENLGVLVGQSILIDAIFYEKGKKKQTKARPCDCYIPAAIAKDRAGLFALAASSTPGITWASPGYVLKLKGSRRKGFRDERKEGGPRRFLQTLGCELGPRLIALPAYDIIGKKLPFMSQRKLIPGTLKIYSDHDSPVLWAVIDDICKTRNKKERTERSVALFRCISHHWGRLYGPHQTSKGEYPEKKKLLRYDLPAPWLSRLAELKWLLNGKKEPAAPRMLVISSQSTRAIYGSDPCFFALGLDESDAHGDLPRVLEMVITPDARELIKCLKEIKGQEDAEKRAPILLRALSERCQNAKTPTSVTAMVDGMLVSAIRHAFNSPGPDGPIFYIPRYSAWVQPNQILLGRDVFGLRRMFVSEGSVMAPLYKVLGISVPTIRDTIIVLEEIASEGSPKSDDLAVLVEGYQRIARGVTGYTHEILNELNRLPLWTGEKWHRRSRPIFYVNDLSIREALSSSIRIWDAPFDATARPGLLETLKVFELGENHVKPAGVDHLLDAAPEAGKRRFKAALLLMRDRLARENESAYNAMSTESWNNLQAASLTIAPHLAVQVQAAGENALVPVLGYVTKAPLSFYFSSLDDCGSLETGGRLVASLFKPEHRHNVSLLFFWAWSVASSDSLPLSSLKLAGSDSDPEQENDDIEKHLKSAVGKSTNKNKKIPRNEKADAKTAAVTPPKQLKSLEWLTTTSVEVINANASGGGMYIPASKGLKTDPQPGGNKDKSGNGTNDNGGKGDGKQKSTGRSYGQIELENAGYEVIERLFNCGHVVELVDFRNKRGIGADASVSINDVKRWVELKAFSSELPSSLTLTRNEILKAKTSSGAFFLAVVTGLIEDMETEVRLYSNPLETLPWAPSSSIVISGLKAGNAILCKMGTEPSDEQ